MFKWKKQRLQEGDCWFEATIKSIGWTYVVDHDWGIDSKRYSCSLFVSKSSCDEVRLTRKNFKTIDAAKQYCEQHLQGIFSKLSKEFAQSVA